MNFSSGVLGLQVDDGAVDTPWVRGVLRGAKCEKKPVKRARALTVNELILLETYLIDGTDNHEDRYACGCFLFCTYARARWGDLVIVADFVNDAVFLGDQSYGYLELDSLSHKLRRTHSRLPLVAPICGVSGRPWGLAWLNVAAAAGCPLDKIGATGKPLLRLPLHRGGWSVEPCDKGCSGVVARDAQQTFTPSTFAR